MSCYENHRSIPQKFEIVRRYFSKIWLNNEAKILDIGKRKREEGFYSGVHPRRIL